MSALAIATSQAIDPIRLAVIQKQVDHISHQMGWIMTRTARSPIFSQSHDFTCFVATARGEIIAQADGIPIHSGGGGFALKAVLRDFGDDIADGDVFLLSDPYEAGGNHLPDWTMIRPVFVDGRFCAFTCNRAHQSDIGGGAAGTYNPEATEIFHNRPTPTHALELKPGQSKPRSAIWPRSWARLRGDVAIVEIARGPAARERAAMALGPRWEVVHTEHGGPFHGAISHPEFARALRAA